MMYTNCDLILSVKDAEDHEKMKLEQKKGYGSP